MSKGLLHGVNGAVVVSVATFGISMLRKGEEGRKRVKGFRLKADK